MNLEQRFSSEIPYLQQAKSWQEGMRYLYSPDCYPISDKQYQWMKNAGLLVGNLLATTIPGSDFIEFRLDFVKDYTNQLWITEIQTDDRGLPAIANSRNASGNMDLKRLPGVTYKLAESLSDLTGKNNYSLLIVYPNEEQFYYAGFYDLRNYLRAENPQSEIIVTPTNLLSFSSDIAQITIPEYGVKTLTCPDLIWDFSQTITSDKLIQPKVTKQLLLDVWRNTDDLSLSLRPYIPKVCSPIDITNKDKNDYILKPIDGRWSKGVVVGEKVNAFSWQKELSTPGIIAQEYINSPREIFNVRIKNGEFVSQPFYSRVEGYYVKCKGKWLLADILATCTPTLPVHGMRECIMIPAKIKEK